MKPKLVLKIVKLPPYSIAVQVAEQDEELRNQHVSKYKVICPRSCDCLNVISAGAPLAIIDCLYIRGATSNSALNWGLMNFKSAEERDEWSRKLQNSLDYINGSGEKEVAAPLEIEVLK